MSKWIKRLFITFGLILSLILTGLPILLANKDLLIDRIENNPFAKACLSVDVYWSGYEFLIGIAFGLLLILSVYFIQKNKANRSIQTLFIGSSIIFLLYLTIIVPKIEQYTQAPLIDFFESIATEDAYFETDFKSYIPYYYGRIQAHSHPQYSYFWLLGGEIDKPAYIAIKIHKKDKISKFKDITFLYDKGGYSFFVRIPKKDNI